MMGLISGTWHALGGRACLQYFQLLREVPARQQETASDAGIGAVGGFLCLIAYM